MTTEKPPWGKVLAEGLSAMLAIREEITLIRMSPQDYGELVKYANSSLPFETFPRDLLKFMEIPLEATPTVEAGFAVLTTSGGEKRIEFQILWELLHEIPTNRFHRIERDIL